MTTKTKMTLTEARDAAYRKWIEAADRGYGPALSRGRGMTPGQMDRVDARIRKLHAKYMELAKAAKAAK